MLTLAVIIGYYSYHHKQVERKKPPLTAYEIACSRKLNNAELKAVEELRLIKTHSSVYWKCYKGFGNHGYLPDIDPKQYCDAKATRVTGPVNTEYSEDAYRMLIHLTQCHQLKLIQPT